MSPDTSACELTSLTVYIAGRFLLGYGNSLAQMSSPLLLTEICPPTTPGSRYGHI